MLYYKNNKWHICPYKAKYTTHGEPQEKYTTDKKWWENFVNKWWHHENLRFEPVKPTDEQLARLDEINNAGIPQGFMADALMYVEYGYVQNKDNPLFEGFSDQQDAFDKFTKEKCAEIDAERDKLISRGMSYDFPDGETGTIQLRDLTDHRNIQGLGSNGLKFKVVGDTESKLPFRDEENNEHSLDGDQLVAMSDTVSSWVQGHYSNAWAHKDNVRALDSVEDIIDYDFSDGWPS